MRRPKALENYRREMTALAAALPDVVKAKKWFDIRNEANTDETEIFIYEEIGYWGITSDNFVQELNKINAKTINVRINSPGGSVWDAIAIYNALVQHSADVNVRVDALAASAASVIAMAGDTITMMRGSQMMIHDAIGVGIGNEAELKEYAAWLGEQSNNIASIYSARAGGDTEEWRAKMLAETWVFADEAVEIGLADEIYSPEKNKPPMEPDEEPDEDPEEAEEETQEEEKEPTPEDRLAARHRLTNRGFKYAGRKRAPEPIQNSFADLISSWR